MLIEIAAGWGAIVSTVLAAMKIREAQRRIEVGYKFVGIVEVGNDIIIRNLSGTPFTVTYWELQFCERKHFMWIPYRTEDAREDNSDIVIQGHSSKTINFSGPDYFELGKEFQENRLYLRLQIAGKRRPKRFYVYPG